MDSPFQYVQPWAGMVNPTSSSAGPDVEVGDPDRFTVDAVAGQLVEGLIGEQGAARGGG
ncbi:hypothetical protein NN3_47600 [Nocardia neocaledoniensis NBRC 108232]|nr:hypothetical protein NN3_47600 [Nocardia neocaledoniensis NBRC 108232]